MTGDDVGDVKLIGAVRRRRCDPTTITESAETCNTLLRAPVVNNKQQMLEWSRCQEGNHRVRRFAGAWLGLNKNCDSFNRSIVRNPLAMATMAMSSVSGRLTVVPLTPHHRPTGR